MAIKTAIALGAYLLALLLFVRAGLAARRAGRPKMDALAWMAMASASIVLFSGRIVHAEDRLRDALRAGSRQMGTYAERANFQMPLSVAVIALGCAMLWFGWRQWHRSRNSTGARLRIAASWAMAMLIPLYALRIVSFSVTDRLLYYGPVPLNGIVELCLIGIAALCAAGYVKRCGRTDSRF